MFKIGEYFLPKGKKGFGKINRIIRIPISGSVPIFDEVALIVDSAAFQRLRGVRQLGPTQYIYPGAVHSRFEHSLGVYYLALKYLNVLKENSDFLSDVEPYQDSFKTVLLAALLHDIGHYPYSHWIEEIEKIEDLCPGIERHEKRARQFIMTEDKESIGKIINDKWGKGKAGAVCDLIDPPEESKRSPKMKALRSLIDSMIDVDKVDYLQRDSYHCGVPYGTAFDLERLIGSLHYDKHSHHICITDKAKSAFSAMLMSRSVMYQELYWHKTVRVCTAMFKRYFYEYAKSLGSNENGKILKSLKLPDDKFVMEIWNIDEKTEGGARLKKIRDKLMAPFNNQGRKLFKPAHIYYHCGSPIDAGREEKKFFKHYEKLGEHKIGSYMDQLNHANKLLAALKAKDLRLISMKESDFIIEMAPIKNEKKETESLKLIGMFSHRHEHLPPVEVAEFDDITKLLNKSRKTYVLCPEKYCKNIRDLLSPKNAEAIFQGINKSYETNKSSNKKRSTP